mmetsp:Transcript_4493/g.10078  ORF Transcript_4493/g.10078 Transcript_4493/m.10078 type:complete len:303 (+) Transcript_4493:290-1198(+)
MRSGMIQVSEVNKNVLLLAEFLGMETLVSATKIRWLVNLGRGPSLSDDSSDADIVAAFDEEYGGISEAIGAGLFPSFLAMNPPSKSQSEVAEIAMTPRPDGGNTVVAREFVGREGPNETQCGPLSAVNGLCSKGYVPSCSHVAYDYECRGDEARGDEYPEVQLLLLRRRKYIQLLPRTEHVFAPSDEDRQVKSTLTRFQYACLIIHMGGQVDAILAPPEFSSDESVRSNPFGVAVIQPVPPCWAESNGFVHSKLDIARVDKQVDKAWEWVHQEIMDKLEGYRSPHDIGTVEIVEREILSKAT